MIIKDFPFLQKSIYFYLQLHAAFVDLTNKLPSKNSEPMNLKN